MRTRFSTLTIVCTLIASSLLASSVQANVPDRILKSPKAQDTFIRQKIREHIGNDPLMAIIAGCESTGNPKLVRHWNTDGTLVKNPGSSASGAAQVLLKYHGKWIRSTGKDMHDVDEYWEFVDILLDAQGYGAWNESKRCWGKYQHLGTS